MSDQQRYDEAVHCLETYGYEVIPDTRGYIVRNHSDRNDACRTRQVDDLIDLAELVERAAQRRKHGATK